MAALLGFQLVLALCLAAAVSNTDVHHTSARAIGTALTTALALLLFCVPPFLAAPSALRSAWLLSATSLALNASHWRLVRHLLPPAARACLAQLETKPYLRLVLDPLLRQLLLPLAAAPLRHRSAHRKERRRSEAANGGSFSSRVSAAGQSQTRPNTPQRSLPPLVFTWRDFETDSGRQDENAPALGPVKEEESGPLGLGGITLRRNSDSALSARPPQLQTPDGYANEDEGSSSDEGDGYLDAGINVYHIYIYIYIYIYI